MKNDPVNASNTDHIDSVRRRLLEAAAGGALAASLGGVLLTRTGTLAAQPVKTLRWGIVGTGNIANSMAPRIQEADHAELAAVSSRKMATAQEFAARYGIGNAFDSWADMLAFDGVDSIYIATPTSVKEEIGVAAAKAGKHVLGDKPFASLASLRRITAACRDNGVGFMDATHFVHHPRTLQIKARMSELVGSQKSVASAFEFLLTDPTNIRLIPALEPYGAIGDAGWYNMRAAVEYLPADAEMEAVDAYLRRDAETGAVVAGSGVIRFRGGATTTFNCGFQSGGSVMDLRISGPGGVIKMDDFISQRRDDHAGVYQLKKGWGSSETIEVPSSKPASTLMFENFAAMAADPASKEASALASERTQLLLDAVWESATANEQG
jgi:predicted dehydrogenase